MEHPEGGAGYQVTAVVRATQLLTHLAEREDQTLSELVKAVGLPRTTIFHQLNTLEALGMIRRAPSGRGYRLGLKLFELGSRALRQIDIREIARPHLRDLVGLHNETAHLGTLDADGTELVCIEKVDSPQAVKVGLWVGAKLPLHATSSGKVVLATMSDRRLDAYLDEPRRRYTDSTITEPADLRAELTRVRVLGYAKDDGEFEPGVSGVAAPITDATGTLVATVSVTAPTARLTARARNHIARSVTDAARTISRELGASPEQVER